MKPSINSRTYLYSFQKHVLLVCPQCSKCADLVAKEDGYQLSCKHCGLIRQGENITSSAEQPTYDASVWLRTSCCGETLWAYNVAHLDFLEAFISRKLRATLPHPRWGWANSSLESRLPKWMTDAGHREEVLKGIQQLRDRVGA